MITADQIGKLISSPFGVKPEQINEIEEIIEKYPYCSTLYILQLIGLSKTNNINFESKLKLAASHVSDREHLFELVHQDEAELEVRSEELVVRSEEVEVRSEEVEVRSKEVGTQVEEQKEILESTSAAMIEDEEVIEEKTTEELVEEPEEIEIPEETVVQDPSVSNESANLDESILSHAIEVAFEHGAEELIGSKKEEPVQEEIIQEKTEEIEAQSVVEPIRTADMSFIEWLKYKQKIAEGVVVQIESPKTKKKKKKKKKKAEKKRLKEAQENSNKQEPYTEDKTSMSKKEINDLLDRFIREEPSLSKPSKEFFNPSKSAKRSLEDSADLVSETLAKIHEMQGNYSKAISAYKQLSLLYPEKKAFFANQIKKIEEKLED